VLVILAVVILPGRNSARLEQAAQVNAQNTATSVAATNNAVLETQLARPTETLPPTATLEASFTPVLVISTDTPIPSATTTQQEGIGAAPEDLAGRTATLAALLTQAARTATITPDPRTGTKTVTALPQTGFADQVGLPGLVGMALLLIIVVFLVRRLRLANNG
jgi:LPXTG-motif cell wall-anchored protein